MSTKIPRAISEEKLAFFTIRNSFNKTTYSSWGQERIKDSSPTKLPNPCSHLYYSLKNDILVISWWPERFPKGMSDFLSLWRRDSSRQFPTPSWFALVFHCQFPGMVSCLYKPRESTLILLWPLYVPRYTLISLKIWWVTLFNRDETRAFQGYNMLTIVSSALKSLMPSQT